ncbi:peptidoglycan DD-metalloendopeptidase family protein [Terrilactibacillus sp. BCM23-1]|uniref:Peptidoglycan DD-metalloendopeptidase family protein n=1 Tax=Terrilactibacillus tamarindi TaxID=2599694 RepID=A0A6N8CNC5_9BACI|nr:M23 family metallopeptidase [Terrilactibacillus tamarindi]MTT31582.1 peptidoglycan DD-metalloendopeptidase family protein [Terrilactibacillus tamarindi]
MKFRYVRKVATLGLALSLTVGYTQSIASAESKANLENKLDNIKNQQSNNQEKIDSSKEKLSENNKKQNSLIHKLDESQKKIDSINKNIQGKEQDIDAEKQKIKKLEDEIKVITKRINERNEFLKKRIRSMYINGGSVNYIEVIMGSNSFGNFLDRVLALNLIAEQDRQILTDQQNDKKKQESKKQAYQKELTSLEDNLANLKTLKANLDEEKQNQKKLLTQLKAEENDIHDDIMDKQEQEKVLQSQQSIIKNQLAALVKEEEAKKKAEAERQAKERAAVEAAKSAKQSTASHSSSPSISHTQSPAVSHSDPVPSVNADFIKPAAGYISSGFGHRSFDGGFHPGIDIANSIGTPIHAAASGVVSNAYHSSSYGNVVMIAHSVNGKTYTTVYAHMTSYSVSTGQTVSQGQVIGSMGNTGESFGSHLHFELYIGPWTPPPHNGSVNPLNYIH